MLVASLGVLSPCLSQLPSRKLLRKWSHLDFRMNTDHCLASAPATFSQRQKVRDTREEPSSRSRSRLLAWCSRSSTWASSNGRMLGVTRKKAGRRHQGPGRTLQMMRMMPKDSVTLVRTWSRNSSRLKLNPSHTYTVTKTCIYTCSNIPTLTDPAVLRIRAPTAPSPK